MRNYEHEEGRFVQGTVPRPSHLIGFGSMHHVQREKLDGLIHIAIITFKQPFLLERMLQCFSLFGWPACPVSVFEDYPVKRWPNEQDQHRIDDIKVAYRTVCRNFNVPLYEAPSWQCCHGMAAEAMKQCQKAKWVMLLSDDVLPTPGCFQSLFNFLTEYELPDVGAIQIPYWTVDDLMEYHPELMESRTQAWWDFGILTRIPRSPWWDYNKFLYDWHGQFNEVEVKPRPYANVHATGFLLNSQVWRDVGGFSPDLAVYDEDISVRIWLNTPDKVVIRVPGPPLVHIHGTATYSGFPEDALKRFDGEANKAKAWGAPVLETHRKCITAQEERGVKWQLK